VDDNDLRRAIEKLEMFSASVDPNVDQTKKLNPSEDGPNFITY
jgi:hypothetical protein